MSAERRWNARRFQLEHSTTTTNGAKTTFIEHMPPGTAVPPHFHNKFNETFDLISGSMKVFVSDSNTTSPDLDLLEKSSQDLEIGVSVTVQPGVIHRYVAGNSDDGVVVLRCTLTPGNAEFEALLKIMNGMAEDGEMEGQGDSPLLAALSSELADATMLGEVGGMLKKLNQERGAEIAEYKEKLLRKYDNEENLKKLLAKE